MPNEKQKELILSIHDIREMLKHAEKKSTEENRPDLCLFYGIEENEQGVNTLFVLSDREPKF